MDELWGARCRVAGIGGLGGEGAGGACSFLWWVAGEPGTREDIEFIRAPGPRIAPKPEDGTQGLSPRCDIHSVHPSQLPPAKIGQVVV